VTSTTIQQPKAQPVRVGIGSFVGTSIEWYDFFLYGTASALVFNEVFFPGESPVIGTLLSFATFGVGFAARPLGGAFFGNMADRVGRKKVLVITLVLMGLATTAIGLLPTYAQVGILAPILLTLLRLLQGFGVGGEWGAAALMAVEHAPAKWRGFFGALPQMGVPAGTLLSTGAFALLNLLPNEDFMSWGWRIPFLASAVLVLVGLLIRLAIEESPEFKKVLAENRVEDVPVARAIREHWKVILLAAGMRFSENSVFYVVTVFLLTYGTTALGMDRGILLSGVLLVAIVEFVAIPAFGAASQRSGLFKMYLLSGIAAIAFAFPFFMGVNTAVPTLVIGSMIVFVVIVCAMYAIQPALMASLFPANVRGSAVSMGYQVASVFAGGLSPFIATALYAVSGQQWWPIAAYLALMAVITVLSTLGARKWSKDHFDEVAAAH
jgi:MFS transporter, MHS family, shikimate and dehydroshikimate transport protein